MVQGVCVYFFRFHDLAKRSHSVSAPLVKEGKETERLMALAPHCRLRLTAMAFGYLLLYLSCSLSVIVANFPLPLH